MARYSCCALYGGQVLGWNLVPKGNSLARNTAFTGRSSHAASLLPQKSDAIILHTTG
jgi:hypothetical protein